MIYAENILICITIPLLLSLLFIHGQARQFTAAFLLGIGICLLSAYISGFINVVSGMGENNISIYVSPVVEEFMKLLPLLFYLFLFNPKDHALSITAVGIGAGFAIFENCCYILIAGADSVVYVLIRGMAVGVMHIVSMLALAFGLIMARRLKALTFPSVVGAVSLSMTFHGLYNLLVSKPGIPAWVGYVLPVLMAGVLFNIFRKYQFWGGETGEE